MSPDSADHWDLPEAPAYLDMLGRDDYLESVSDRDEEDEDEEEEDDEEDNDDEGKPSLGLEEAGSIISNFAAVMEHVNKQPNMDAYGDFSRVDAPNLDKYYKSFSQNDTTNNTANNRLRQLFTVENVLKALGGMAAIATIIMSFSHYSS